MVDSTSRRTSGVLAPLLAALAFLNLAAGFWLSFSKGSFSDLLTVDGWVRAWLAGGNPYVPPNATDYPPWALVTLSPLAVIPGEWLPLSWVALNIALVFFIAARLAHVSDEPPSLQLRLMLLLASTASMRTLAQFSHLSFALAVAGALSPSALAGGLLVGLSLMKPQIGGVVLLWLAVRGEWRRVGIAMLVPAVLLLAFSVHAQVGVATVTAQYLDIIGTVYGVPADLPGHTELRVWIWQLHPSASGNLWLSAAALAVLLAPVAWIAIVRRTRTNEQHLELLALCGVVSLLAVRHLSYDFILLLPAVVAWRCPPFAISTHAPRWLFASVTLLLVVALPSWVRLALDQGAPRWLSGLIQLDRALCLGIWGSLSWRLTANLNNSGVRQVSDTYLTPV